MTRAKFVAAARKKLGPVEVVSLRSGSDRGRSAYVSRAGRPIVQVYIRRDGSDDFHVNVSASTASAAYAAAYAELMEVRS